MSSLQNADNRMNPSLATGHVDIFLSRGTRRKWKLQGTQTGPGPRGGWPDAPGPGGGGDCLRKGQPPVQHFKAPWRKRENGQLGAGPLFFEWTTILPPPRGETTRIFRGRRGAWIPFLKRGTSSCCARLDKPTLYTEHG